MSPRTTANNASSKNTRTFRILALTALAMLALGFASKPLYDTFCKVTGYGGTTRQAEVNNSTVLDRVIRVSFDSNVSAELPWSFKPEIPYADVKVGQSTIAYYTVTNTSSRAVTGIATFNVTPIKAAPYFTKTECFCFTEQTLQSGETVDFPVIFFVDSLIAEEARNDDVKNITLSYTFFESATKAGADNGVKQDKRALN